ncbi:MAG: extracellular solute-binding protein [Clostridia bacterium]|nr:extracellular solute-binding protein [Clostridia bacterium]
MKKIKRLLACLMAVSCLAGASASLVGCDFGGGGGESSSAAGESSSAAGESSSAAGESSSATGESSSASGTEKVYKYGEDLGGDTRSAITLNISAVKSGYGLDWLQPALDAFKELDWVKQKYPRLTIAAYVESDIETQLADITASTTDYDLFVSVHTLNAQVEKQVNGEYVIRDLTDLVNCVVPWEDVTLGEKMNSQIASNIVLTGRGGEEFVSSIPWNTGKTGIVYNETRLNKLLGENTSENMPRTTNEFLAMLEDLNEAMPASETDQPFVITASSRYMGILQDWWMQYEGIEQYENYYQLVDENGDISSSIFAQQGRLRSLEVLEDILQYKNIDENLAYVGPYAEIANQQNRFCMGTQGVFTLNGDWFYNEAAKATLSAKNTVRFMQSPVVSAIVDKCETVNSDEKLSFVIGCVDEDKDFDATATAYSAEFGEDLPEDDYDTIFAARRASNTFGGHSLYVRAGSDAEAVALDFIRFLATDEGNKIFMDSTSGILTPYIGAGETNYKVPAADYAKYPKFHQDRIDQIQKANLPKDGSNVKSIYYGGWQDMFPDTPYPETFFYASNAADRKTAEDIWQGTIDYYTGNNNAQFNALVAQSQIN